VKKGNALDAIIFLHECIFLTFTSKYVTFFKNNIKLSCNGEISFENVEIGERIKAGFPLQSYRSET
jgi:hypothetical protein